MLFGTFVNPKTFVDEYGFYDGASARVIDMHLCRDVSRPKQLEAGSEQDVNTSAAVN
jgi:hypothetical protein